MGDESYDDAKDWLGEPRERHPGEGFEDGGRPHKRAIDWVHYGHRRADDTLTEPREAEPVLTTLARILHERFMMPGHAYPGTPWKDACDESAEQLVDYLGWAGYVLAPTQPVPSGLDRLYEAVELAKVALHVIEDDNDPPEMSEMDWQDLR
ncbi:MAG TPA: hypothetical protein VGQ64_01820 [Candidatus Limnocylindrales bacterium]|nr:hypothetical protein [Candidatus Limnocylindrales bacterium]